MTQEQAIALLGIGETTTLSRYENGHSPVSQDLAAAMVKLYRTPLLAYFHLRYTNPDLAKYLPEVTHMVTDGDAALQMEIADDDITDVRQAIKAILRDGFVSPTEAETLKINSKILRSIANKLMSAASYLERREPDE